MEFKADVAAEPSFLEILTTSFTNFATAGIQVNSEESTKSLKCPRCDSSNTKFCYYNNYRLTQPRYFCKSCKRYWTEGGTLRDVPVGGGCRKNKRSKSDSKAQQQQCATERQGSVEDLHIKVTPTSAVTSTGSGNSSSVTNATVFSSSEVSGSGAIFSQNVIGTCVTPQYLKLPDNEQELMELLSDAGSVESRVPNVGNITTSGIFTAACDPEEERSKASFNEQQILRNPVINGANTKGLLKEKLKSNSLQLGGQDFSSFNHFLPDSQNLYFNASPSLATSLAADASNSQWLDQITIHNNETCDLSQIVRNSTHSKCNMRPFLQPEEIFYPSIGTELSNCSKFYPRMQNDEYLQVILAHAGQSAQQTSKSESSHGCMTNHLAEKLSQARNDVSLVAGLPTMLCDVSKTIFEWQMGLGGFSSHEPCDMGDTGVWNQFPPFDARSSTIF